MIPKFIRLDLMYRDASNYKTCENYYFSNNKGLDKEVIESCLKQLEAEPFIPFYYGITNHPAPINNEFLPLHNNDDHSYVELCEWDMDDAPYNSDQFCDDISDIVEAVQNPSIVASKIEIKKKEATNTLQEALQSIRKK